MKRLSCSSSEECTVTFERVSLYLNFLHVKLIKLVVHIKLTMIFEDTREIVRNKITETTVIERVIGNFHLKRKSRSYENDSRALSFVTKNNEILDACHCHLFMNKQSMKEEIGFWVRKKS